MVPFFENNNNLTCIEVSSCDLLTEGYRLLSKALVCCKSLKHINIDIDDALYSFRINVGQIMSVIESLGKLPLLETVEIQSMIIEPYYMGSARQECVALSTLLQNSSGIRTLMLANNEIRNDGVEALSKGISTSQLHKLSLRVNHIGDSGVEVLVVALRINNTLRYLDLSNNYIKSKGLLALSTLLEHPDSNLEELVLDRMTIGDDGALNFAKALKNNHSLKRLTVGTQHQHKIKAKGWNAFETLLCDRSSVDATFLSNHTLASLDYWGTDLADITHDGGIPIAVESSLVTNRFADKVWVAKMKVLSAHPTLDMTPLFEWELKALPYATTWFDETPSLPSLRKLQVIYQFIRTLPGELEGVCNRGVVGSKRKAVS